MQVGCLGRSGLDGARWRAWRLAAMGTGDVVLLESLSSLAAGVRGPDEGPSVAWHVRHQMAASLGHLSVTQLRCQHVGEKGWHAPLYVTQQ